MYPCRTEGLTNPVYSQSKLHSTAEAYEVPNNDKSMLKNGEPTVGQCDQSATSPENLYDEVGLYCNYKDKTDTAPDPDHKVESEISPENLYDEIGLYCNYKDETDTAPDPDNVYDDIELRSIASEDIYDDIGFPEVTNPPTMA